MQGFPLLDGMAWNFIVSGNRVVDRTCGFW